jgi:hypothetical protein
LVYATVGASWPDGANETEINAARQVLVQDMKILEAIAPDSGAYLNEVTDLRFENVPIHKQPNFSVSGFKI